MEQNPELVFDSAVEGLFVHGIPDRVTAELKSRLRNVGLDLDKKLRPAYERAQWRQILDVTLEEAFKGTPKDQAFRQLGQLNTRGYERTMLGRSLIALTRIIGPRRMLDRLTRSLGSANTYVAATVEEKAPGDCEVRCTGLDSAYFMAGILDAAMEFCRPKEFRVDLLRFTLEGEATYRVNWTK